MTIIILAHLVLVPQRFSAHHFALLLLVLGRDASQKHTPCYSHHRLLQQAYEQGVETVLPNDASLEGAHLHVCHDKIIHPQKLSTELNYV